MKLVNLLAVVSLLLTGLDFSHDGLSVRSTSLATTATVVVTNATDSVNGDTSSIGALIANPGLDGISFREAIDATNNTLGLKTIEFAATLLGATIFLDSDKGSINLTSGQLTINGDVDFDGASDITLNGSLDTLHRLDPLIFIWSSNNVIRRMALVEFNTGIKMTCPDPNTLQKTVVGNRITENSMSSTQPGSLGISIGGTCTDTLIQDTLIDNNTIPGVFVISGVGGGSHNQIVNTTIMNNHFPFAGGGIGVGAADTASDFWGVPGPIQYSDNNLVDHVAIINNVLEENYISIGVANQGNRYNGVQHVQIANNTILRAKGVGIFLVVSGNSGPERSTSFNALSDIQVDHNTIVDTGSAGILVGVGDTVDWTPDTPTAAGIDNSQLSSVQITDNDIENYREAGIRVWGGAEVPGNLYSSNNLLDQLTISGNRIIHSDPNDYFSVGIELLGAESFSGGPTQGNIIQGAIVCTNTIGGNRIGISLIGGRGTGAQGNRVVIAGMQANDLAGNNETVQIIDNSQGAVGNFVDMPYKIYLPVVEQNN